MHGRLLKTAMFGAVLALTISATLATSTTPLAGAAAQLAPLATSVPPVASAGQGWVGAEQSILVDRNLRFILIGDVGNIDQVHRSTDGGVTWRIANAPMGPQVGLGDGTAMAQDAAGTLYAANTDGPAFTVSKSANGGQTWTQALVFPEGLADRPWLAAKGPGQVALIGNDGERTDCYYSTDGFTTLAGVSTAPLHLIAGNLVFDSSGSLWFSIGGAFYKWLTPCLGVASSADTTPLGGGLGAVIQTQIAVANGYEYTAVPSAKNAQMQVRSLHGLDGASEKTVVVSDAATMRSNAMGAIAAKPDGSEIAALWYGSSTAGDPSQNTFPSSATWNVYAARVTGFQTATPTVTVTTLATNAHQGWICMAGTTCTSGRNLLDYIGITYASDGSLHATWGNDSTGTTHTYYAKVP